MKNKRLKGLLFAIFGALSWGASGVISESLFKSGVDVNVISVYRMFFAGIVFIALAHLFPKKRALGNQQHTAQFKNLLIPKNLIDLLLFSLLGMLLTQYGYLLSISYSDAGTATMICYIGPVFVMIASAFLKRKMPKTKEILAISMAILGVFLLATKGNIHTLNLNPNALLWGILSAIGMIFYTLTPRRIIVRYGSTFVMGYALIIASLTLALSVRVWELEMSLSLEESLKALIITLGGTVGAFWLFMNGVIIIGATKASLLACLEPLCAALLSFAFLGTYFTSIDIIAFACIISTVFLMHKE